MIQPTTEYSDCVSEINPPNERNSLESLEYPTYLATTALNELVAALDRAGMFELEAAVLEASMLIEGVSRDLFRAELAAIR